MTLRPTGLSLSVSGASRWLLSTRARSRLRRPISGFSRFLLCAAERASAKPRPFARKKTTNHLGFSVGQLINLMVNCRGRVARNPPRSRKSHLFVVVLGQVSATFTARPTLHSTRVQMVKSLIGEPQARRSSDLLNASNHLSRDRPVSQAICKPL